MFLMHSLHLFCSIFCLPTACKARDHIDDTSHGSIDVLLIILVTSVLDLIKMALDVLNFLLEIFFLTRLSDL